MRVFLLVDQAGCRSNAIYLVDFIEFRLNRYQVQPQEIRRLYLEQHLSASQIAERFGVSKSTVVKWVKDLNIGPKSPRKRMTHPENYRHRNPPYGYLVKNGKLVLNNKELKICRLVVELVDHRGYEVRETARELIRLGFKNRRGDVSRGHITAHQIYKRWKGKL